MLHAEFSFTLHAKEFLLYFTWPLPVTLLRVHINTIEIVTKSIDADKHWNELFLLRVYGALCDQSHVHF